MNPRNTGILFLVAIVVVGGVWWNENVRKEQVEEAEAEARELFPELDEGSLRSIALETTDGQSAQLARQDGVWRLREPLDFPVDRTAVDGVVAALVETRSASVIEAPQDPDVYGLGDGATVVHFGTEDAQFTLRVGDNTPVGGNTYAARDGDEAVYAIPSFRASALRRSLVDLREKRVLRFDRAAIARIELSWPGDSVTLERNDRPPEEDDGSAETAGWRLIAPLEDAADDVTVDALLSDLAFLRAEDFMDAPPSDAEVGLDRPAFEAKLTAPGQGAEDAPRVFHLKIGRELENGQQRPARAREHALYLVPTERLADFPQRVAAYRFKELASFEPDDAKTLEIAFHHPESGAHVVLAERGEDGWVSSPENLAPGKAARIVAELARLRGSDIVADAMGEEEQRRLGLDPPRVRFRVRAAGAEDAEGPVLADVWLGDLDAERGIVARSGDRDRIYRIDFALAEHLPVSAEALRNRFQSKEDPGSARFQSNEEPGSDPAP